MLRLRFLVDRVVGLSWLLPLSLVAAGCSSAPPDGGPAPTAPAPSVATEPTASSTLSLKAGVETEVSLHASPEASCTLREAGSTAEGLRLFADDLGDVSFHFRPREIGVTGTLSLECESVAGLRSTQSIGVRGVATDAESTPIAKPIAARKIRPALTGDVDAYSDSELLARGFPPRPDRAGPQYARWLAMVQKDASEVPAPIVPHYGREHTGIVRGGGTGAAANSPNWSGAVKANGVRLTSFGQSMDGPAYKYATGEWNVPLVSGENTLRTDAWMWVGLGGWWGITPGHKNPLGFWVPASISTTGAANTPLIQNGTASETTATGFGFSTSYYAWAEYWTNNGLSSSASQTLSLKVSPGDQVSAYAWSGDAGGTLTSTGAYGWYYLYNETTKLYSVGGILQPTNAIGFWGEGAEWIMERPGINPAPTLADMANYGSTSLYFTWCENANNVTSNALSATEVDMYNSGTLLSDATIGTDTVSAPVNFVWKTFH